MPRVRRAGAGLARGVRSVQPDPNPRRRLRDLERRCGSVRWRKALRMPHPGRPILVGHPRVPDSDPHDGRCTWCEWPRPAKGSRWVRRGAGPRGARREVLPGGPLVAWNDLGPMAEVVHEPRRGTPGHPPGAPRGRSPSTSDVRNRSRKPNAIEPGPGLAPVRPRLARADARVVAAQAGRSCCGRKERPEISSGGPAGCSGSPCAQLVPQRSVADTEKLRGSQPVASGLLQRTPDRHALEVLEVE